MEYPKEVDIATNEDDYAIGNDGNNKPLAECNDDDNDDEYASAARCAESIILSATPAESMIPSALTESIMLSSAPAESMILEHSQNSFCACNTPKSL
jgi:hypothetical protein